MFIIFNSVSLNKEGIEIKHNIDIVQLYAIFKLLTKMIK
jgi:hypothetical protein